MWLYIEICFVYYCIRFLKLFKFCVLVCVFYVYIESKICVIDVSVLMGERRGEEGGGLDCFV